MKKEKSLRTIIQNYHKLKPIKPKELKTFKKELKSISKAYENNFNNLIKYANTKHYKKYVKIERELNKKGTAIRNRINLDSNKHEELNPREVIFKQFIKKISNKGRL